MSKKCYRIIAIMFIRIFKKKLLLLRCVVHVYNEVTKKLQSLVKPELEKFRKKKTEKNLEH